MWKSTWPHNLVAKAKWQRPCKKHCYPKLIQLTDLYIQLWADPQFIKKSENPPHFNLYGWVMSDSLQPCGL